MYLDIKKGENPQSLIETIVLLLLVEGVVTCEHPPTRLAPHQNLGTTCLQPGGEAPTHTYNSHARRRIYDGMDLKALHQG